MNNEIEQARRSVRQHKLARRVFETDTHLTVVFPLGFKVDGIRIAMDNGPKWAYDKALEKMQKVAA